MSSKSDSSVTLRVSVSNFESGVRTLVQFARHRWGTSGRLNCRDACPCPRPQRVSLQDDFLIEDLCSVFAVFSWTFDILFVLLSCPTGECCWAWWPGWNVEIAKTTLVFFWSGDVSLDIWLKYCAGYNEYVVLFEWNYFSWDLTGCTAMRCNVISLDYEPSGGRNMRTIFSPCQKHSQNCLSNGSNHFGGRFKRTSYEGNLSCCHAWLAGRRVTSKELAQNHDHDARIRKKMNHKKKVRHGLGILCSTANHWHSDIV